MSLDGLPIPVDGADLLKRLAREVEVLKRHTHESRDDGDEDPDNPYPDETPPKAPSDLTCESIGQVGDADYHLSWTPPTESIDNSELTDLLDYEVQWQYDGDVGWVSVLTITPSTVLYGLTPGIDINWQVRARDKVYNLSDWATATCTGVEPGTGGAPDTLSPDPPTSLGVVGSYIEATDTAEYVLSWTAPTTNTDATPLTDLMDYEVQWKYTTGSTWSSFSTPDVSAILVGLTPGIGIDWQVRARDTSGNPSTWATDSVAGVTDSGAPTTPSTPTTTTKLGTITVTWDGLDSTAGAMPPDFSHLEVFVSDTSGFTPSTATYYDSLVGPGSVVVTGVPVGDTRYFKTVAYDQQGNSSPASAEVSMVAQGVQGPDLEANSVTSNAIAAGAITAEKIAVGVLQTNLVPDPSFEMDYDIETNTSTDGWRIASDTGTTTVGRGEYPRSGQRAMTMVASLSDGVSVFSGNFDVTPGATYVLSIYAGKLNNGNPSKFYARMAGGTDDNLTEYPGSTNVNGIPLTVEDANILENVDVNYLGSPVNPDSFSNGTVRFTVPAGIVRAAVRVWNYQSAAAQTIVVDDVSVVQLGQGATEITSAGIRLFGTEGTEVGAFVSNRPNYFSVTDADGATVASISDDGNISGQTVYSENDIQITGKPVLGDFADFEPITDNPEFLTGWMDGLPRGVVGHGYWNNGAIYDFTTTRGIFEVAFKAERGRAYRVTYYGGYAQNTGGSGSAGYEIRLCNPTSLDTEAPTPDFTNSTRILRSFIQSGVGQYVTPPTVSRVLRCNPDDGIIGSGLGELNPGIVKLFVTITGATSTIRYSANEDLVLVVEDVGPDHPNSKRNNYTESGNSATTTPTTKSYTSTWSTSDTKSYNGAGNAAFDQSVIKHGYDSYEGNSSGAFQFNYSSIQSALSTAGGRVVVIKKVEVYLYANHWWYNSGGTAYLRYYNATSIPSTRPTGSGLVTSANWPKPGGRWVNVGTAWGTAFQNGNAKGVLIGNTGSTSLLYYGRFNTSAKLRITYTVTE